MEEEIANAKRRELEKLLSESSDEYDDESDSNEDSDENGEFEGSDIKGSRPQMEEMSKESDSRLSQKNKRRFNTLTINDSILPKTQENQLKQSNQHGASAQLLPSGDINLQSDNIDPDSKMSDSAETGKKKKQRRAGKHLINLNNIESIAARLDASIHQSSNP